MELVLIQNWDWAPDIPTGEENFLLKECLSKGVKVSYFPAVIASHFGETSGNILSKELFERQKEVFLRKCTAAFFGGLIFGIFLLKKFLIF